MDVFREVDTARRSFTEEFKAGAVRLVPDGKSVGAAARDLDFTESRVFSTFRPWPGLTEHGDAARDGLG